MKVQIYVAKDRNSKCKRISPGDDKECGDKSIMRFGNDYVLCKKHTLEYLDALIAFLDKKKWGKRKKK